MTKRILRTFHPVGHGAFYVERFFNGFTDNEQEYVAVYDCGSRNSSKRIKDQIETTFNKDEIINVVFISHLHDDHVNGLDHLIQYCKVKTVVFPYVSQSQKKLLHIDALVDGSWTAFSQRLVGDPVATIDQIPDANEKPLVVFVKAQVDDHYANRETRVANNDNADTMRSYPSSNLTLKPTRFPRVTTHGKEYLSGRCICPLKNMPWIYVPYVIDEISHSDKLEQHIGSSLYNRLPDDWAHLNQSEIARIRDAYNSLGDGINANSLIVYSGPDPFFRTLNSSLYRTPPTGGLAMDVVVNTPGCIYLGDFKADANNANQDVRSVFNWVWSQIATIQIPHHGSLLNYDKSLSSKPIQFSVISCRSSDAKHPDKVLEQMIFALTGNPPLLVTETPSSLISFTITTRP